MNPAVHVHRGDDDARLLVLRSADTAHAVEHARVAELGELLDAGDLVVVNRSATVPASLSAHVRGDRKRRSEIRLASFLGPTLESLDQWNAVLFGAGDWRTPTEARGEPEAVTAGERLVVADDLHADIDEVDEQFPRLVRLTFHATRVADALHRYGRPIQYSYLDRRVEVEEQQTIFAGPAVSVEPPSASFPLTWQQILRMHARGIEIVAITHSAGISSTGDPALDVRLPLPEWFDVPAATAAAINRTKDADRRVVAVGTSVVRAVESCVVDGRARALSGVTSLRLGSHRQPALVDALVSGLHEHGTSHLDLVRAFVDDETVTRGYAEAEAFDYRMHEYGDVSLMMA